ncbi:MAG: hypothetical protein DWP92_11430 [Armatimonadetes bacterium]|nr:MAG: hypothetical protein DWP92_11430 [Armatimonadota bacterium]
MKSVVIAVSLLAVIATSCASGPDAPPIAGATTVCADTFCIDVPDGWTYEVGEGYVSAHHDLAPSDTFLTAGVINFEAIVVNAGGVWPASTPEVARSFWKLLEDAGVGTFARSQRVVGGAERSWGRHEDGAMWHLVVPTGGSSGIGVEMRAPNDSWEAHADFVFDSVTPTP